MAQLGFTTCKLTTEEKGKIVKEKNKNKRNFDIELATNKSTERSNENSKWINRRHWTGTICCLGPDRQHGRRVYLCLGPDEYFVSSRETDGSLTYRAAPLEGTCPSRITLELAIRLLDKKDADFLRVIAGSSRRRGDIVS